jgi:transcriptional regulator with XRE-family HTH domain
MTIGERIKLLRKEIGLTQAEFAEKIGLKQAAIGMLEKSIRNITDRNISQISTAFNVREEWLRTGEGEKELPLISNFLSDPSLDDADRTIISGYLQLTVEQRKAIKEYIRQIAAQIESTDKQTEKEKELDTREDVTDIDQELARYRKELEAEKKGPSVYENSDEKKKAK